MKKLALVLVVAAAGLAGCVAVPYDNGPPPRAHGGHIHGDRDRDGDGVRNRNDRRPNDPRRY